MFKHWILTDTHFGHKAMSEFCGRPADFSEQIVKHWQARVAPDDVLIHLGDVGNPRMDTSSVNIAALPGRKILVRGNHDKQSTSWYLQNGWQFVCEQFMLQAYGHSIMFSHIPQPYLGNWTLNIHGHFHNTDYPKHEPNLAKLLTPDHVLYALEYDGYAPWELRSFLRYKKKF